MRCPKKQPVANRIYLNSAKSESFGVPYAALRDIPESEREFRINTLTLWAHDPGSWDDKHKKLLFPERYVTLRAKDYGWWEVIELSGDASKTKTR